MNTVLVYSSLLEYVFEVLVLIKRMGHVVVLTLTVLMFYEYISSTSEYFLNIYWTNKVYL